jgi:hypothetical protein
MNGISSDVHRSRLVGTCVGNHQNSAQLGLHDLETFLIGSPRGARTHELNISANEVLLAMATGLCLMGPLVWIFVRYWLFAL